MTDFNVVKYHNYEDYLRSFAIVQDYRYLPCHRTVRTVTKLGYRDNGNVYNEEQFLMARKQVEALLHPSVVLHAYYSPYLKGDDAALVALAEREAPNVQQEISTIIFLEVHQKSGFAISGYIDFESSLRNFRLDGPNAVNWPAIFQARKLLRPQPSDVVFYDWRSRKIFANDNDNYTTVAHAEHGLLFIHKGDHKLIPVTNRRTPFYSNVKRTMIKSELYGFMILYDHTVRKKT
ncbi:cilia- and flagella-associated protein 299 [Drosophila miranda]|uniref:cilia- and flagella-associated protein 299 n=1 Tax=Drosophila miranda TaxID=7229 RepID=UPI0007E7F245|nr:cilia- and flagella-associated protein 299 [Drosophila miranda]